MSASLVSTSKGKECCRTLASEDVVPPGSSSIDGDEESDPDDDDDDEEEKEEDDDAEEVYDRQEVEEEWEKALVSACVLDSELVSIASGWHTLVPVLLCSCTPPVAAIKTQRALHGIQQCVP